MKRNILFCFSLLLVCLLTACTTNETPVTSNKDLSVRNDDLDSSNIESSPLLDITSSNREIVQKFIRDNASGANDNYIYYEYIDGDITYKYLYKLSDQEEIFSLAISKLYVDDSWLSIEVIFNEYNQSVNIEVICKYILKDSSLYGCSYELNSNFNQNTILDKPYDKYFNGRSNEENFVFISKEGPFLINDLFIKFNCDIKNLKISLFDFGLTNY